MPTLPLVTLEHSIRQTMVVLNQSAKGIALVVDSSNHLITTITDGDIRRSLLAGRGIDQPVSELVSYKSASPITAWVGTARPRLLQLMQDHSIRQLPLLDLDRRVVDLITLEELLPEPLLPLQAVIMAGGFGTRLRPLTDDIPKPMLPVGGKPLMERLVSQLQQAGIRRINVTTHYKPEKIVDHFGDGRSFGVELNYVHEAHPLGTGGALGLMATPTEPMLVINGDILTEIDFRAMLKYHQKHNADITMAVRQYEFRVPYGVIECDGPYVQSLREKPAYQFLINAGIYLIEPSAHGYIPPNQRFDMTELIDVVMKKGGTVASFPIIEYWLDIGQHADYNQAQEDLKNGRVQP